MSAEQMFQELGYEKDDTVLDNGIRTIFYSRLDDDGVKHIEFVTYDNNEVILDTSLSYCDDKGYLEYTSLPLNSNEFKAVVQQMRELGVEV